MSVDKLVDSTQLDSDLTSVANAIRTKGGTSAQLSFPSGFVNAVGAIPSGNWTLIDTKVFQNVAEYTNTSAYDEMDTGINISNTDYAWGYIVTTCDSAIEGANDWGMTVSLWGRYTSNGAIMSDYHAMQRGCATLSKASMTSAANSSAAYGVRVMNNKNTVIIGRKCHATACPKCRAGNYTVKVYGMTAF